MPKWFEPIKATFIAGVIFMIPLFIVGFVLTKLLALFGGFVNPVAEWTGLTSFGGVTAVTSLTVLSVVLAAYFGGLFSQTEAGQSFLKWIESGVISLIPAFHVLEGLAKSVEGDDCDVLVVLVPTDAGWQIGLVFEPPQDDWYAVYLPGSPQWTSGSMSYAHARDVKVLDIPMTSIVMILSRRGPGSGPIFDYLAKAEASADKPVAVSSGAA
ncbi:hypothetical protein LJR219_003850 [Phenylobacterium sp. LjRoot219]|uniref:hypothetical protein n=1 Tax=Phenylobacterium sp. LjRoot219 TaxID=3342283 RepID=UPI003ECEB839